MSGRPKKERTPSQRMRGILYLLWQEDNEGMTSEEYYLVKMEALINVLLKRLEPRMPEERG